MRTQFCILLCLLLLVVHHHMVQTLALYPSPCATIPSKRWVLHGSPALCFQNPAVARSKLIGDRFCSASNGPSTVSLSFPSPSSTRLFLSSSLSSAPLPSFGENANDRRRQSLEQGNDPLISLNMNLDALAQSGSAAPRAQELLERIQALYQEGYYEVPPDIVSYNSVLKAWKMDNNPEQAYTLLQEMLQMERDTATTTTLASDSTYLPTQQKPNKNFVDVISLNTVILAFSKKGNYPQAEDLLRQMLERDDLPSPDTITYNSVLYSFCVSQEPGTAIQAENLLREMMTRQSNVTADTTSFNTVIYAWCQAANPQSLSAAHRAQELLEHMEELYKAGNSNVEPDVYSYTTVIQAWAKCNKPSRSKSLMDRMTMMGLSPNQVTYTSVISALAKGGKAEEAENLLDSMMEAYSNTGNKDIKPDTVAFSSVMRGWAQLSHVDKPFAAQRALDLLTRMKNLEAEGMGPNAITYTSCLTALAKSGTWDACEEARLLLEEMEYEYQCGKEWLRPSNIHYNTVLNAYARSPRADKALVAAKFFRKMQNHPDPNCQPDIISHNSLLMACANAFGNNDLKKESFQIALDTFKRVLSNSGDALLSNSANGKAKNKKDTKAFKPTSTTFAHFCKASRRLLPRGEKLPMLKKTLKLCCDKGMLNPVVVQQVQMACRNEDEWRDTSGGLAQYVSWKEKIRIPRTPKEWVRNARR